MKRKFRLLRRWCLILAVLVNTVAPVWAAAAMDADLLRSVSQRASAVGVSEATRSSPTGQAGCESDTQAPGADTSSDHEGCDCGASGTCTCPCTFSVKLIGIRVEFAARHLLSTVPVRAVWESADPGPRTSLFRPPIA
jgi:hypothetical protein